MKYREIVMASTASLALVAHSAAHAQTQASSEASTQTEQEDDGIGENLIIVRGEKTARDLQETVSSVSVVTGAEIERNNYEDLNEIFDYIPNINTTGDAAAFTIRGVRRTSVLGAGSTPLAQIYVDGSVVSQQAADQDALNIWDLEQVEVLRGAQSTIQGRNALAGAVVLRTAEPTFHWTGKARASYSFTEDYGDETSFAAAIGGPIIDDLLAFRISAETRDFRGHNFDPVQNRDDVSGVEQQLVRARLLLEPSSDFSALFTYAYQRQERGAGRSVDLREYDTNGFLIETLDPVTDKLEPTINPELLSKRLRHNDVRTFNNTTTHNFVLEMAWDVADGIELKSVTTYNDSFNDERGDLDNTNRDLAIFGVTEPVTISNPFGIPDVPQTGDMLTFRPRGFQTEQEDIFTQELTLSFDDGDRFSGVAGLYYAYQDEEEYNFDFGLQEDLYLIIDDLARSDVNSAIFGALNPLRGVAAPGNPVAGIPADPAFDAFFQGVVNNLTDASLDAVKLNYPRTAPFYGMTSEPLTIENYAFYARGEFKLTDTITLGAGLRYDYEDQRIGFQFSGEPINLPNAAAPQLPDGFEPALIPVIQGTIMAVNNGLNGFLNDAEEVGEADYSAWLPSAHVRWEFAEDKSVFASYRRGYRAGGAEQNLPRQFVSQFDPEYTDNFEVGFRTLWLDGALRFNGNVFYTKWTDQQQRIALSDLQQDNITFNVGKSTLRGFEIDWSYDFADDFTFQGGIGYHKNKFEDFSSDLARAIIAAQGIDTTDSIIAGRIDNIDDIEGDEFGGPNWSGSMRLIYNPQSPFYATIAGIYQGSSNAFSVTDRTVDGKELILINATAAYEFDNGIGLSVFVRNLLDKEYLYSTGFGGLVDPGDPRTIGLRVSFEF